MMGWLPPGVSTYSGQIDWLFYLIYYITTFTFFAVQITLLWFAFKYRYNPNRRATYTHGNTTLEIVWTVIPALMLAALAIMSRTTWADIKWRMPPSDYTIWVTAKQFNWEITYPGPDGKLGTEDDVSMDNDFHVPVNKTVRITLRSKDVIHSFFVPVFRLKQDAVPGREIPVWFKATAAGKYEVPCAELCGFGHSGMQGSVYVDEQTAYDAWAKERGVGAAVSTPAYN
ncbi:MAG TPA: cytochrome c oxidase subunit II [Candidatus Eisenbacteria bacterium]|nr:cytochrome c oxidase subunit II [Candidatus Eisenbacteria bacterium]